METSFGSRLKHAWNAFINNDTTTNYRDVGIGYSYRPDRPRLTRGNERSIVNSVYNRIALDASAMDIQHVRLDKNNRFLSVIDSGLNNCLTLDANIDQTSRAFMQDVVMSMFDEGSVALVPVDTTDDPTITGSYDIDSMRTGQILEWYPKHVKIRVYNENTGQKEDITTPKSTVSIIENPLYSVMNEPNSTLQRLIRKLNLLDVIDEQSGSGKLDLIIQLPYVIKTEARRQQADQRRKDIEMQLSGSKYGIAYTDGTERITSAITDEMKRKFLTKTARTQMQSITFFRDPFKLVPVNNIAEIADKFTRNEIMTSNEIRQIIGMKPSDDPKADQLVNSNISQPKEGTDNIQTENLDESKEGVE